ncbi:MAG: DUF1273 family protein [Clostridia bacterium]|nr:DUF1273 family protein [Clostridia bacterium]
MTTTETTTVCFTGHRTFSHAALLTLPQLLEDTLTELIQSGYDTFRTGGALGFDTMAALKVLELKARFPHIRLHLYLPCRDQGKFWNEDEIGLFQKILERADDVHYTAEHYTNGCMLQRNREMIDGSAICIAYFDGHGGGTAYSYGYANRTGVKVINLAQYTHREEEQE